MQSSSLVPRYGIVMMSLSRIVDSQADTDWALVRVTAVGRARSTNEWKRNVFRILVGKAKGKRHLGKPR